MSTSTAKFTVEHYEHMIACGAFAPFDEQNQRIELLNGEINNMEPPGEFHSDDVSRATSWSYSVVDPKRIRIRVQDPIRIPGSDSAPQPDLAWVKAKDYRNHFPNPEEVLLVIEVADSSLAKDQGEKLAVYAGAGIPEYWIVNLIDKQVEVYREPSGQAYAGVQHFVPGQAGPSPLCLPGAVLDVSTLF